MKTKQLIAVAEELTKVLGLDPKINLDDYPQGLEELKDFLIDYRDNDDVNTFAPILDELNNYKMVDSLQNALLIVLIKEASTLIRKKPTKTEPADVITSETQAVLDELNGMEGTEQGEEKEPEDDFDLKEEIEATER